MRLADLKRISGAAPVLAELTDARLLTVSDSEVELSHEALLREWRRHLTWLEITIQANLLMDLGLSAIDAGGLIRTSYINQTPFIPINPAHSC